MQLSDRIGRRMKLQDLHVLMTVVQAGSMRKAATVLNTSQPAISRSIAELENAIGVRLLDRDPKGVGPTAYGRALLDGGIAMFDELRQAVKNIEFLADPTAGEVRVGCPSPVAGGLLTAVIERLSGRYPRVRFHVVEGDVIALQREVHERNIDLAIGPVREPINDENLISEILFDDRLVVAAGAANKWLNHKRIKLSELLREPWIFPHAGTLASSSIAEAFLASGLVAPKATVSSNAARLTNNLLASGRFLSMFPESMIKFGPKHLPFKVLPVEMPKTPRPVVLFTLKNRTLSPVAQLFIDCVREIAKPLAKKK